MGKGFARQKKQAKAMQEKLAKMQEEMMNIEAEGTAGNGLVSITLKGEGEMTGIKIKPDCVDPDDIEGLEDLIKAAYTDAQNKLKAQSPMGGGMPDLSGGMPDLSTFGF